MQEQWFSPPTRHLRVQLKKHLRNLPSKKERVTRVELNRRTRRKEQLKAKEETKKIANISREINSLPYIINEIAKEDEEKRKRHVRRVIARQERLKSAPPRLGKHSHIKRTRILYAFKHSPNVTVFLSKDDSCEALPMLRHATKGKGSLAYPEQKNEEHAITESSLNKLVGSADIYNLEISVDKEQVKAVIRAQQEQQIDSALLAEGRFYSDLKLAKEIEHGHGSITGRISC